MLAALAILVVGAVLLLAPVGAVTGGRLRGLDGCGVGVPDRFVPDRFVPDRFASGGTASSPVAPRAGASASPHPSAPTGRRPILARDRRTSAGRVRAGPRSEVDGPADVVVLLDLLDVAVTTGAGIPRALRAVGVAVGGPDGPVLGAVGAALLLGASWSGAWAGTPDRLHPVARTLEQAWTLGAAPGTALRRRAASIRRDRRRAAREAAGRLGVLLVLPLGLCFLPAFVLTGLVPVLISLGSGLLG